jgi:DNA mismatch endonuclease (patch repair protein)
MADIFTKEKRSKVMGLIRSKGNASTELALIKLLKTNGITGWRRNSKLLGRPDFVFPTAKLAVFVDGDFWHGHPTKSCIPKSNRDFWTAKVRNNRRRDRKVVRELRNRGWKVRRIWESSLRRQPRRQARRITALIQS